MAELHFLKLLPIIEVLEGKKAFLSQPLLLISYLESSEIAGGNDENLRAKSYLRQAEKKKTPYSSR